MKKLIDFDKDVRTAIQEYADLYCKGNYTMALHIIVREWAKNEN